MSSFLAVRVSTERSQHTLRIGVPKETIGGEIVDRDRNHEAALALDLAPITLLRLQDVVRQQRFLDISARAEQPQAGASVSGTSAMIRGGPRIASFEPSEASRWRPCPCRR